VRPLLPAALAMLALVAPAAAVARAPEDWKPGVRRARAYALGRTGLISFGIRTERGFDGLAPDAVFPSASVVKAMLMVAYLRDAKVRARPLTPADRRMLTPMVRWSSNRAATRVRDIVGNDALARLARRAGMRRFVAAPSWGSSLITARDQTRFFLRIDRLVPRRHRRYAMGLLRRIVEHQRWGVAQAIPRGWRLYFKGGWGSGEGGLEHQVALLRRGKQRVAIAILTLGNPDAAYGHATEEGIARRLLRGLAARR
jgi:beta-lactamase class A